MLRNAGNRLVPELGCPLSGTKLTLHFGLAERGGEGKDARVAKTAMRGAMQTCGFAERFMKVREFDSV